VGGVTGERQVRNLVSHIAPDVLDYGANTTMSVGRQQWDRWLVAVGVARPTKKLRARSLL